jgi:cell wall-associated NlpC family hydrolase/peptidoglycan hydrolase CwlO-like protein
MPRRVNPVILLGIVIVVVLSFGLSAGAAPEDGTVPENVPEKGVAPNDESTALDEGPTPGEVPTPAEGPALAEEGHAADVPEGNIAPPEKGSMPEDRTVPDESTSQGKEDATSAGHEDDALPEGSPLQENAESDSVRSDTPEEDPEVGEAAEEVGQEFQKKLEEAEVTDEAYNDALLEENQLTSKIAETRNDLKVAEDNLDEAQGSLEKRASQMYMDGQDGFLGVLLGAKDVDEFTDLLGLWMKLIEQDKDEVEKWRESSNQLERSSKDLETQLDDWEQTRKEAADKKEAAENSVNEAQEFFKAQDEEIQKKIEDDRTHETELALDHVGKLLQEATQEEQPSPDEEEKSDETSGDEQTRQAEEGSNETTTGDEQTTSQTETGELERTPEKEKVVQAEVAQALTKTIGKWQAQKKPLAEAVEEPVKEPNAGDTANKDSAGTTSPQEDPAAKQLATAAEEQAKAQDQAKQATEQVAAEKAAQEEAAAQADEAEKAKLAAQQVPAAEQEKAQGAADEAERKAKLAAEQAAEKKKAAEDAAAQATEKQNFAVELEDAATQKAAEEGVLGPKPIPGASGNGVIGEAKDWLGVPYDYTHMGGMTRAGVDCSAFTAAVYKEFGITLPDDPAAQFGMGTPVIGDPKAGDLVFFNEHGDGISHVGIANGDGTLTHASDFTGEVSVTPMKYLTGYAGARRFF